MAAFPPGAVQERRRCALFWAVSTCGCAAADAQFHAQEIRRAHLWRGSPTERELKSSTYQVPVRLSEIGAEQYRERVAQAIEFLEGKSREMIAALEEQMRKAAEKMDFEKAAELRNMVADLR